MADEALLDRRFLEKLERLTLRWQKSFPGLVGGHNLSRFPGQGQEFLDHRHFHHGDDLRAVNWRAYLRLEKLFLKMFRIEPRVPVRLLVDVSRSMATGRLVKFDYARKLTAALAFVGMVRLDTLSLHAFSDSLGDVVLCSGGRHRFGPVAEYLSQLRMQGVTDLLQVARQFVGRYMQRGLVIILSDFLCEEGCEKPLQYLGELGHELFVIQIWAEEDRAPPWSGELDLEDAESGARTELDFDAGARLRYTDAFDDYCDSLNRVALAHGGRYVGLSTAMPVEEAIFGPIVQARGAY